LESVLPEYSVKKDLFRLGMILAIFYFIFFNSLFPFFTPAGVTAAQNTGAQEIGMGGFGYLENPDIATVISFEGEDKAQGIPEPESFSRPRMLLCSSYTVQKGDMIGDLAAKFGLNEDTLISVNNIKNTRLIQIGQTLRIPNQDGILYTIKAGEKLEAIAERYETNTAALITANELFSESVHTGTVLFVPGAKMDWVNKQEINGDLFIWPVSGYITSSYGYRKNPFGGARQFHTGLDIGAPNGRPVKAAMAGRVIVVGSNDPVFGNYVVLAHHSGYRTLYGHLSVARVKAGAYVATGERIGDVGSTGLSTGYHLHFTVYKNGVTVNPRTLMK
jgi:murein DD-endopeptidase MepM/ murein hydrolase activator NlpD